VAALIVLRGVGLDPRERWPGLWLKGEVVTTLPSDWSFTDTYQASSRRAPGTACRIR
jgi:hypothetical protein